MFAALQLSADNDDKKKEAKPHAEKQSYKPEWDALVKQHVLHADGTPKSKAEYHGIQRVYRDVKEEVVRAGGEFTITDRNFRTHVERILKAAEDARGDAAGAKP